MQRAVKRGKSTQTAVRLPDELLRAIDRMVRDKNKEGYTFNRSDMIRSLLWQSLVVARTST